MPLAAGARLGPYEIVDALGAGGMGEVFRARDTKLSRDVAIKILPTEFAFEADRLARFKREAQVLASMNHPNIAAIYGFEDSDGVHALVLELVEGPTLADRIARGPIPLEEAVAIAKQIADALDAAHRQGIVHRDLKPTNIKLRSDGTVKVLDFGLAKVVDATTVSGAGLTASPTMIAAPATMTRLGVILGTAAYMSPEQARGKEIDSRTDVWAFGCVLYEMLAGEPLFHGETTTDVLAAIINRELDLSRVPATVQRLLRACLEREVRRRLQAAGDAWLLLDDDAPPRPAASRLSGRGLLSASVAGVLAIIVTATVMRWREPIVERGPLQFHANLPEGMRLLEGNTGGTAISPDGRTIAFAAVSSGVRRLWLRRLDSLTPHELSGTTGADYPFWSPDGRSIGFFAEGKLKKVDSSGGQPIVLAEAATGRGGTWLLDGTIIFASASVGGLHRISASGGAPTPVTKLDLANGENAHRWPQFLPGGRRLLYFVRSSTPNRTGVYASSLERPHEAMFVLPTSTAAAYAVSRDNGVGHLIWVRDNRLVAQPFDAERLQLSGESAVIPGTEGVGASLNSGRAAFSLSQEGTLLFAGGEDRLQLEWIGRDGRTAGTVGAADRYTALRISPDGVRAAVSLYDGSAKRDIWTLDVTRGLPSRVTSDDGFVPVWSPDAERIAYHDTTQTKLLTIAADGSDRQVVLQSQVPTYINDWSPDGHTLLYSTVASSTFDLWLQPLGGERKPKPWLATPYNESHGQLSPDGKWVSFTTDDSGQQEIFVSAFEGKFRRRVSTSGGSFSRWRADGKELFYRALDGRLIAVPVSFSAGQPEFGTPVALIDVVAPLGTFAYPYDLSRDGQKILTFRPVGGARIAPMTVLINWQAGLTK